MNPQDEVRLHVLDIVRGTTVDGPGFRTSIYLAGCTHNCPGCHNPQSHSFSAGQEMTISDIIDIVEEEDFDVTLSGGDPLCSPQTTLALLQAIKKTGHNVWVYTGYTCEEILDKPELRALLPYIDTLVDGPFIMAQRDTDLLFRGSSNQRIIKICNGVPQER